MRTVAPPKASFFLLSCLRGCKGIGQKVQTAIQTKEFCENLIRNNGAKHS